MKKLLLLALATLLVSPCVSETPIKSSNNNLTGNNNDSIVSEQDEDKYEIRFLNDEGTEISTKKYEFGVMPKAPDTPTKENPLDEYTYTFSGWSPSISLVTTDVDYVATYKTDTKIGKVVWVDGDGKTLLSEDYAYGSMPNYHGDIPTKTATDTETYVFKGWDPINPVASDSTTYTAQFNSVLISTKYSIAVNCTNCLVNKKKSINEKHDPLADLTYQFNNISKETHHYPYKLDVIVDGKTTNDYVYDNITGRLNIKLTGNTVINAIADNSCVLMKYKYSEDYPTVEITCDGVFEGVDWGDGTPIDATSKSHTYSHNPDIDHYYIRIFGKLNSFSTRSEYSSSYNKGVTSINIFHSVTSIGDGAFANCSSLTSITIPSSVTSIGDSAFYNCSSLASINISDSVTSIGVNAFSDCSSLTSIIIPNSVTSIRGQAFRNCSSLTSIIIPNSVTSIGYNAFEHCSSLTSITIPSSVTSIGSKALVYCSSLTSITIPNSVTSIGDDTFCGCSSLTSIVVDKENPKYDSRENCNAIIETQLNKLITGCKNTIIPNSVTSIGVNAFRSCSSLTSIAIPNSVTSIGDSAFEYCSSLTSINIPNSVTLIGDYALCSCTSLTSITIPNSVTSIGQGAFEYCPSLASITIPNSVTSIGILAFSNCTSLTSIVVDKENPIFDSRENCNAIIETQLNKLIIGCKNTIIPNSVTSIGDSAFSNCSSLTSITIPNSVTSIGREAFSDCSSLTSITIPNSVTSIGSWAFAFCFSLTIYCEAESKPSGWDSNWNYSNRPVIWGYVENGECNNFKYCVTLTGGNKSIVVIGLVDKAMASITIPSIIDVKGENIPVTSIGDSAFEYCSSLTSITIPNSVTSIGDSAFEYCFLITTFDLSNLDHVIDIESSIFSSYSIPTIKVKSSMLEKYKTDSNWSQYSKYMQGV